MKDWIVLWIRVSKLTLNVNFELMFIRIWIIRFLWIYLIYVFRKHLLCLYHSFMLKKYCKEGWMILYFYNWFTDMGLTGLISKGSAIFFAFVELLKMWWNMMGMEIFNSSCSCSKEELYSYAKGNYFMPIFYNFAYHHFKGTIQVNGNSNLAFCCSLRWSTITYFD